MTLPRQPTDSALKQAREWLDQWSGDDLRFNRDFVEASAAFLIDDIRDEALEKAARMLDEEHDRCFRQEHAIDKSAGQHADMIRALKTRTP